MKRIFFCVVFSICVLVFSEQIFAQEQADAAKVTKTEEKKAEETKDKLSSIFKGFSGQMFLQFKVDTLKSGDEGTTFALERAYLNYKKDIWGPVSIKVTSDVGTKLKSNGTDSSGDTVTVDGQAYEFFIKNAYIQVAHDWDFLGLNFKFGIIPTPSNTLMNSLQDLRWIDKGYSFAAYKHVDVTSGETTADVGASLTTRIFKYVELNYAFCHGEGYKHPEETYDGKSHYGTISIIPYKGIYLNGFINYERAAEFQTYFYYGGGAAYKSDFLKTGANFIIFGDKATGQKAVKYHFVEAWVNFFLGHFVEKAPLIFIGRFGYGKEIDTTENFKMILAGGVGWQFNKHFRVAAYYESKKREDEAGEAAFYIKTEAKF